MKRKVSFISLGIVLMLALVYGTSQARPMAPALKVGVLISSSGPLYFAGAFQKAAAELAVSDLAKSVAVSLFYEDAGDTEAEAKSALARFSNRKIDLLLAPIESESAKRVLRLWDDPDVPVIATSSLAEGFVEKANFFRLASTVSQDSYALAEFVTNQKPKSVAVVSSQDEYSKVVSKSVAFGLTMRGIEVKSVSFTDLASLKKLKAESLILVSMEQSAELLSKMPGWLAGFRKVYLVPGNLANYSMFGFAKELDGATGLLAFDDVSQAFRVRLANQMNRQNILSASSSPMFGLARRTYQAIYLVADQLRKNGSIANLSETALFSADGFYQNQRYSVVRYSAAGVYSVIGVFDPKNP